MVGLVRSVLFVIHEILHQDALKDKHTLDWLRSQISTTELNHIHMEPGRREKHLLDGTEKQTCRIVGSK